MTLPQRIDTHTYILETMKQIHTMSLWENPQKRHRNCTCVHYCWVDGKWDHNLFDDALNTSGWRLWCKVLCLWDGCCKFADTSVLFSLFAHGGMKHCSSQSGWLEAWEVFASLELVWTLANGTPGVLIVMNWFDLLQKKCSPVKVISISRTRGLPLLVWNETFLHRLIWIHEERRKKRLYNWCYFFFLYLVLLQMCFIS